MPTLIIVIFLLYCYLCGVLMCENEKVRWKSTLLVKISLQFNDYMMEAKEEVSDTISARGSGKSLSSEGGQEKLLANLSHHI